MVRMKVDLPEPDGPKITTAEAADFWVSTFRFADLKGERGPAGATGVAIGGGGGSGWSPSGLPAASDAQPPLRRELLYTAEKLSEVRIYQDGATLSEVRQLAYDGHGRLASITYRDGSMVVTHTRTLGYDGTGLLSAITDTTP